VNRRRWWIAGTLGLVVVLAISAGIVWPARSGLVRWLLLRKLGAMTHRQVSVERVDVQLRQGRLEISGVRLADREPGPPLAELDHLDLHFDPGSLLRGRLVIGEIALRGLRVRIVRSERGDLNVADLLSLGPAGPSMDHLTLDRLTLAEGQVALEDRTRTPVRSWRADSIAVEANGLFTHREQPGSARLVATVAGAPISVEISGLVLAPLRLRGRLALKDVDATLAGLSLPADVAAVVEGARLTADVAVTVDHGVSVDADGRLDALALRHRGTGDPLANVPSLAFTVSGARSRGPGDAPTLGRVEVTGAATLFDARGAAAGHLAIDRLRVSIEEGAASAPSPAQVTITAALSDGGGLDVRGPLRLAPFGAALRARLTGLDPTVLLSYVELPARVSGTLDTDLTIDLASAAGGVTSRIRGRAWVSRAVAADGQREIATVRRIEVDGVDAAWPRVAIGRIRVIQPAALVERDQAGRLAPTLAQRPSRGEPMSDRPGPTVEIGEIAIDDGTLTLDDAAALPPARLTLAHLRASAHDVAWPARRPVSIDLRAVTPGAGTLEARGTLSLDPVRIDVRARLAGAALAPYQGYLPFPARVQGFAHLDLAIAGSLSPTAAITAHGRATLTDLGAGDDSRRVLRVARVDATGLAYAWPATLTVDRLHVGRSWVRVERKADGTFPLRALFARAPRSGGETAAPGGAAASPISVTVRDALLEDGRARFVDATATASRGAEVSRVRVAAHGFTWPARGPMPIELRAATPGGGRLSVDGALDLAVLGLQAKVVANGVDLAPALAHLPLGPRVAARAGAELDIEARLDPLSLSARGAASLADVVITDGDRPLVNVARVETTGLDYAWPGRVTIDRLRVESPRAMIERMRDGAFPLAGLFTAPREPAAPAASSPPPPPIEVAIRESLLQHGSATLIDGTVSPAARIEVRGVRLVARDFVWPAGSPTSVRLRASLPGGGTARARGQLGLAPVTLDLDVTLDAADLGIARPYLPVRGEITGKADAVLKVTAAAKPLAITARGTASLTDLTVAEGEERLLTADRLDLTGLDYAWPATIAIDRLRIQKPWALIDRVTGQLPVMGALSNPPPRDGGRPERASTRPPAALDLAIRRSIVANGATSIVDDSVSPPARFEITDAKLFLRDLAWPPRGPSRFVLRAATPAGGTVEARGHLRLDPAGIDTRLLLARADLATLQPLARVRGRVGGKVDAELRIKGPVSPMALSITGHLAMTDGSFGDAERALVTAKGIDLAGIAAEWPRRRATIQRIGIREPWALVERDAKGAFPLLALTAPRPADGAADGAGTPALADGQPHLEVGTLVVEEGFVRFTDGATRPPFVEEASHLGITARRLGTAPATRSEIAVNARLTGGAQADLRGTMGPLGGPLFADVEGKLSGLALKRVNPYLNGLLGWIARKGSVDGTTQFRIHDDRIEAENEVVIGQPLFVPSRRGDEVRKRVGVPLDLLAALLEDSHRQVRLSVPVTGTLSSHEFDFGDAVWDAIRRAAVSVLALPVSWVGKIFYTPDSRIETISIWPVSFEPGTARVRREMDRQAARLATFMHQTPAIAFTLKAVMTVDDVDALKREALRRRIDTLARDAGSADAATAKLFAERFPGRPAPVESAAMVAELAKVEPLPDAALPALATARVALVRRELEAHGGVNPARLRASDGALPVESSGFGRVEFEMTPDAGTVE
jgi:hypothetical protein